MRYRNGTGAGAGAGAESVGIHQGNSYSCTARSRVLELVFAQLEIRSESCIRMSDV